MIQAATFPADTLTAVFNDELYEMQMGRSGVARLQSFGVIFGYKPRGDLS